MRKHECVEEPADEPVDVPVGIHHPLSESVSEMTSSWDHTLGVGGSKATRQLAVLGPEVLKSPDDQRVIADCGPLT